MKLKDLGGVLKLGGVLNPGAAGAGLILTLVKAGLKQDEVRGKIRNARKGDHVLVAKKIANTELEGRDCDLHIVAEIRDQPED